VNLHQTLTTLATQAPVEKQQTDRGCLLCVGHPLRSQCTVLHHIQLFKSHKRQRGNITEHDGVPWVL